LHGSEPCAFGDIPIRRKSPICRNVIDGDSLAIEKCATTGTPIPDRYATEAIEKLLRKPLLSGDLQMARLPVNELNVTQVLPGNI